MKQENNIVVFGGTFDPVHIGHLNIISYLCNQSNYTRVVCVPNHQNPLKFHHPADGKHRVAMLELALSSIRTKIDGNMSISHFELEKGGDSYSIDTITHIKKTYSCNGRIGFVVGSDIFLSIMDWSYVADIAKLVELIIVPRPHYISSDIGKKFKKLFSYSIIDNIHVIDAESHIIRKSKDAIDRLVTKEVRDYIIAHKLYAYAMDD